MQIDQGFRDQVFFILFWMVTAIFGCGIYGVISKLKRKAKSTFQATLEQVEKLPPEQQDEIARLIRDQMSEPEAADDSELVKMALEAKELHRSGKTVPFDC